MSAETADVLVLGSGITGLAAARALRRAGRSVVLVDPAPPGGTLETVAQGGYTVELGPNTVQGTPELREMAANAGCAGELTPAAPEAKRRYLVHRGALVALPGSPPALVTTPILSAGAKLRLLAEPFRGRGPGPDESVAAFFARRVGRATAALADAMVLGIYAGDPRELRIGYAFERVHRMEREHGSLFAALRRSKGPRPPLVAFAGGFAAFARRLAAGLTIETGRATAIRRDGDRFQVPIETASGTIERSAARVVTALPAAATASLFAPLGDTAAIADLPHSPVAVVALGLRRDQVRHPLDGFGFLAPHAEGRRILGCLFSSTLFPDRAPAGRVLLTAMVGGRRRSELVAKSDDELRAIVRQELGLLLGVTGDPELALVRRWQPGIPQPTAAWPSAGEAAAALERALPGLTILGSWRYGVGVPACVTAGWRAGGLLP